MRRSNLNAFPDNAEIYSALFFHQAHLIEVANIREWKLVVSVNHEKGKKYSLLIHSPFLISPR